MLSDRVKRLQPSPTLAVTQRAAELRAAGHHGKVELLSGLSQQTVPAFLHQHPGLYFDLITIDGAKTVMEVAGDFANALPRLRVGGVVVFDDLPIFPHLSEAEQDAVVASIAQFVEANPVRNHVLKGPNFLVHRTHRASQADTSK